jgi:O-antigen/teichoic acid export membrane protein
VNNKDHRKIVTGILWITSGYGATKIAALGLGLAIGHFLSPTEVGVYAIAFALYSTTNLYISGFPLRARISNILKSPQDSRNCYCFQSFLQAVALSALILIFLPNKNTTEALIACLLLSSSIIFDGLTSDIEADLRANGHHFQPTLAETLSSLIQCAFVVSLIATGFGFLALLSGIALRSFLKLAILHARTKPHHKNGKLPLSLWINALAFQATTRLFYLPLVWLHSPEDVGQLFFATQIALSFATVINTSIQKAFVGVLSSIKEDEKSRLFIFLKRQVVLLSVTVIPLSAAFPFVFEAIWRDKWELAGYLANLFLIFFPLRSIQTSLGVFFEGKKRYDLRLKFLCWDLALTFLGVLISHLFCMTLYTAFFTIMTLRTLVSFLMLRNIRTDADKKESTSFLLTITAAQIASGALSIGVFYLLD